MQLTTLTLGPDQMEALKLVIQFHLDNDDPEDSHYDFKALEEVAEKLGLLDDKAGA